MIIDRYWLTENFPCNIIREDVSKETYYIFFAIRRSNIASDFIIDADLRNTRRSLQYILRTPWSERDQ